MKTNIEQLKADITGAKQRHTEATKDVKRIEKDMKDFDKNKDSKLAELQSTVDLLRKSQTKASAALKDLQKAFQSARLEVEQAGADQGAVQDQSDEVERTIQAQEDEVKSLTEEQRRVKVCPCIDLFLRPGPIH